VIDGSRRGLSHRIEGSYLFDECAITLFAAVDGYDVVERLSDAAFTTETKFYHYGTL
jgi:hypothetical protein